MTNLAYAYNACYPEAYNNKGKKNFPNKLS